MALTRAFLKGMSLTDEQVSAIIEAHTDSTNALKEQRDEYKAKADKADEYEKELNKLKSDGGDWQTKYDKEHSDFEAYKTEQEGKEAKRAKETAYKALLKEIGITEKRIESIWKVTDADNINLNKDGTIKDAEKLTESIKTEWSDFITTTGATGANTSTPPNNNGGGGKYTSKSEIMKIKDTTERQRAIAENPALFGYTS